jgi:signal peptidase I
LAVLVYDADLSPRLDQSLPPRWQSQRHGAGWGSVGGRFAHAAEPGTESIDWLTYHHWYRVPGLSSEIREAPITNQTGYNQSRPPHWKNVHPVSDVMLSFRLVSTSASGRLVVRATDGSEEFCVWIDPASQTYEVFYNGKPLAGPGSGKLPELAEETHLEVSLFDSQFVLAFDGRPALTQAYTPADLPPEPTSSPLAIGSQGLGVQIWDLRVYRDVYYTHPVGVQGRWGLAEPVALGEGEYFVLGDNSSISSDSRTWPGGPAVAASLLLGKPFLVHFPAMPVELGHRYFQVPNAAEIRYIR